RTDGCTLSRTVESKEKRIRSLLRRLSELIGGLFDMQRTRKTESIHQNYKRGYEIMATYNQFKDYVQEFQNGNETAINHLISIRTNSEDITELTINDKILRGFFEEKVAAYRSMVERSDME